MAWGAEPKGGLKILARISANSGFQPIWNPNLTSNLGPKLGYKIWSLMFGHNFGCPMWVPHLLTKFGAKCWCKFKPHMLMQI